MQELTDAGDDAGGERRPRGEGPVYMHISDVRRLLNLSENGFRFYEKKGVISPFRNEENGYRVMFLSDGLRLFDAYDLTRYGLSIDEADEVLSSSVEGGVDKLRARSDAMARELQEALMRKEHLDNRIRSLREYVANPLCCSVTEGASLAFLPVHYQDMSLVPEAYDDGPRWWKVAPLVDAGLLVTVGCDNGGVEAAHGPVTSERVVGRCGLPDKHALRFCRQGQRYLRFFVRFPAGCLPSPDDYVHAFVYLASHGLKMSGDKVLHRMLRHVTDDGVAERIDEAFMPVASFDEG